MRTLSPVALNAVLEQQTDVVYHTLLTIDHPDFAAPIRVVDNNADVVSNGETYTAFPFLINLPAEQDNQLPHVQLTIDAIDQTIIRALKALTTPPTVELSVKTSNDPDVIEVGAYKFTMSSTTFNALILTSTLRFEDLLHEPYPSQRFLPSNFPGLF